MINYYTDSARKSLWVLTCEEMIYHNKDVEITKYLTCFAAQNDSGFHIGQKIRNPKLTNSNWQPLEGEILVEEVLKNV